MDMDYLTLEHKKFLVEHYVYDAWQFTNNAAKGVATARFCCCRASNYCFNKLHY